MRRHSSLVTLALLITSLCAVGTADPAAAQGTGQPIASTETNWPGVGIDLMSVERKGNVLTVKWAVRNQGSEQQDVRFALTGKQVTTYVVDEESGTKYYVLTDKEQHSVASMHEYLGSDTFGTSEYIPAGESRRYWAKFPAPPPEVKTVTLFFSKSEPFEEVPITDR